MPPTPPVTETDVRTARLEWAGRRFDLHPEGAVACPETATVWIADTHFGKPASFRHRGVPVPDGGTAADTAALDRILRRTAAERLVILGDFLHDAASRTPETFAGLAAWRAGHPGLDLVLVRGNHDDRAGDPPADLGWRCVDPPHEVAGVTGLHHPPESGRDGGTGAGDEPAEAGETPTFAGHVHPVVVLRGAAGRRERCRCFHWSPRCLVLPAFGSFTGGHRVAPGTADRIFVAGPTAVVEVPTSTRAPRRRASPRP